MRRRRRLRRLLHDRTPTHCRAPSDRADPIDVHRGRAEPVILASMRHLSRLSVPVLAIVLLIVVRSASWSVCATVVAVAGMIVLLVDQLRPRR